MAEHDLTATFLPYLDRHLAFPLLAHLSGTDLFDDADLIKAEYELVKGTTMFDYAASLFLKLHPDEQVPDEFESKKQKAVSTHHRLQQEAQAVLDVIENPDVAQALRQDKNQNLQYLKDNYNLSLAQITALYHYGKFQYASGNYSPAADYLYHFRVLSTDPDLTISAQWGKLASDILSGKWDTALEELNALREVVDSRTPAMDAIRGSGGSSTGDSPALNQLQARTWLSHWALFVYFNHDDGRKLLLETFLSPAYLNTIQTSCPWILRYLASAAILSRPSSSSSSPHNPTSTRVKHAIRDIVKVIQMEEYQYHDPITDFLKELYVDFDFAEAQRQLTLAVDVVGNDFFLSDYRDDFLDNARSLISEAYCRIHQRIDIRDLSQRLNLTPEEGEKWIVNLIRETRMGVEAKIDLEKNIIEIHRPPQPVYQTVIEKTRGLGLRSQALNTAVSRALHPPAPPSHQQTADVALAGSGAPSAAVAAA